MDITMTILERFQVPYLPVNRTQRRSARYFLMTIVVLISLFSAALPNPFFLTSAEATSSHKVSLLEIPVSQDRIPKTLTFPVYEQNSIQYFSAGLGKEERSLSYPPFPLKLIFVQGERAFLAGVSVQIRKEDTSQLVEIPGEEVEGPWLFIKIPTGTYLLTGTDSKGSTLEKTVVIKPEKRAIVHFRFP